MKRNRMCVYGNLWIFRMQNKHEKKSTRDNSGMCTWICFWKDSMEKSFNAPYACFFNENENIIEYITVFRRRFVSYEKNNVLYLEVRLTESKKYLK